jgi:phytoene desaturase
MPIAPDLQDNDEVREYYFNLMCDRIQQRISTDLRSLIEYKKSYCLSDFKEDYHAFKGNAYGLANTLLQTAFLKPKMKHSSVKNLFFTGQLTTPGPGVPPSIISGQVVANFIINNSK